MKILVTGGLGFVGINLVRYLAQTLRCPVIAADVAGLTPTMRAFLESTREHIQIVRLDVRDRDALRRLVEDEEITHLVHAAAITPDLEQERSRAAWVVDVNLGGAMNALAVGYETEKVERVLICSSSGVYGAPTALGDETQAEDGALQLDNLYAITKLSAELLAERFAQLSGKKMASVRLGSVYGPCEKPSNSRQRVSQVQRLANALSEGRTLRLCGPEIRRDWVYSVDVAEAIRALLCAPAWNYPVYNIGSGAAIAFADVAAPFIQRGLQVEWVEDPEQADIPMTTASGRTALNLERLHADSGFTPQFSFSAGVADYLGHPPADS